MGARPLFTALWLATASACSHGCFAGTPSPEDQKKSVAESDVAKDYWLNKGQLRPALDHALQAAELDDRNAKAAHLVALIYLDFCSTSGDCRMQEAETFARAAVDLDPEFREAQNTLGVILVHLKAYDRAIAVLKQLSEDMLYRTPENAWGNLGWAHLEAGHLDEAIDALRRAVAVQPGFCVGHFRLGSALEKKRSYRQSLAAYSSALDNDHVACQRLQPALAGRARMLLRLGHTQNAREELERCIALDKSTSTGKECRALLDKLG